MKKIIIVMLMLFSAESFAADSSGDYTIHGAGSHSCGTFIEEHRKDSTIYYRMGDWVLGYFTAINIWVYDGKNISHGTDVEGAMLWIRNYCQQNPLKILANATEVLYWELKDK